MILLYSIPLAQRMKTVQAVCQSIDAIAQVVWFRTSCNARSFSFSAWWQEGESALPLYHMNYIILQWNNSGYVLGWLCYWYALAERRPLPGFSYYRRPFLIDPNRDINLFKASSKRWKDYNEGKAFRSEVLQSSLQTSSVEEKMYKRTEPIILPQCSGIDRELWRLRF